MSSDSRENPALWRFPSVHGTGHCQNLGIGQRCDAPEYRRPVDMAAAPGTTDALVGWDDVPTGEGATLDNLGALGPDVLTVQPFIPGDRHSRGGGALEGSIRRGAEAGPSTGMTVHRTRNFETRFPSECSRQIAHSESKKDYEAWQKRRSEDCSACSAPTH